MEKKNTSKPTSININIFEFLTLTESVAFTIYDANYEPVSEIAPKAYGLFFFVYMMQIHRWSQNLPPPL